MMKRMGGNEDVAAAVKQSIEKEMSEEYPFIQQLKMLKNMNGTRMMLMPFSLDIQ